MKLSEMSKDELKKTPYFHLVNPELLESIDDYAAWLEALLNNPCSIWDEDDEPFVIEIKQFIASINGLKIEIYSNEHPPPHFHVNSANVNASFDIENCKKIEGHIKNKDLKKIKFWHSHAKPILIERWNSSRPTNCTVGAYNGT